MSKTGDVVKKTLQIWGVIALAGVLGLLLFVYYGLSSESKETVDGASRRSINFALNASGFGEERLAKVVRTYESRRSFTGDGFDVYAIQLTHVSEEELLAESDGSGRRKFFRGDHLPDHLVDALEFFRLYSGANSYVALPDEEELRSKELYVYARSITYSDNRVYMAELVFVRPSDSMLYFFDGKI
jgi:hypothetical protein